MFNTIWQWLNGKPNLDNILGHFNKVHDQLSVFITHADGLMQSKTEQAKKLAEEAAQHSMDMARAAKAQLNIRNLLGN